MAKKTADIETSYEVLTGAGWCPAKLVSQPKEYTVVVDGGGLVLEVAKPSGATYEKQCPEGTELGCYRLAAS